MSNTPGTARSSLGRNVQIDQGALRYVLDQARDCIKILAPEGHVEYVNSEGRCALAITDIRSVCGKRWPELWPEASRPVIESALDRAKSGEGSEIEACRPNSRGEDRWWRISVSPIVEDDGEVAGILTVSRDVTEHVRLRESEQTMAHEMRHRLRNAYTVASAIVTQSARNDEIAQPFAERVCGRLADVAISQSRLLEAGDKSWTVADLVRTLIEAHGEGPGSIRFAGEADAVIDGHEAMLIALVIGELTNNSLKYGALRQRKPVTLSWTDQSGRLELRWREPLGIIDTTTLEARDPGSGYSLMARMARSQSARFHHLVEDGILTVTLGLQNRRSTQE